MVSVFLRFVMYLHSFMLDNLDCYCILFRLLERICGRSAKNSAHRKPRINVIDWAIQVTACGLEWFGSLMARMEKN